MERVSRAIDLDYVPREWQYDAQAGLIGKSNGLWICSRQIGKTWAAVNTLISRALRGPERASACYICPAQTQARRIAWPVLKAQLAPMREYIEISETQLMITLPGERRIYCLGAESGDNIRGASFRTIVCDERDSISDEFWRQVMLPTTNRWGDEAFTLYIGTLAGGDSTLWRMYLRHKDDPDWFCRIVPATDAGVFTQEWISHQRAAMGESAFRREMECDPHAPVEHAVLGEEMLDAQREGRVCRVPYHPGEEVHVSLDLGVRDFTTAWLFTLEGSAVRMHAYREFSGIGFMDVMTKLREEFRRVLWGEMILPHDAKNRNHVSGSSVLEAAWDKWPGYVYVFEAAPNKVSTLNAARMLMPACEFDEKNCQQGILRLKSARYVVEPKTGTVTDKILHDDNSHAIDAFRYGAMRVQSLYRGSSFEPTKERPRVVGALG